jgi:hypothetical protein
MPACLAKTIVVGSSDLRGFWPLGLVEGKGESITGAAVKEIIGILPGKFIQEKYRFVLC